MSCVSCYALLHHDRPPENNGPGDTHCIGSDSIYPIYLIVSYYILGNDEKPRLE